MGNNLTNEGLNKQSENMANYKTILILELRNMKNLNNVDNLKGWVKSCGSTGMITGNIVLVLHQIYQ